MRIRDLMHDSASVSPDSTLEEAMRTMAERCCAFLPVVEGNRTLGVVTEADLSAAQSGAARVEEFMSHPPISIDAGDDDEEALRRMLADRVWALVVLSGGRYAGVVTIHDLARRAPGRNVGEALVYLAAHHRPVGPQSTPEIYIG